MTLIYECAGKLAYMCAETSVEHGQVSIKPDPTDVSRCYVIWEYPDPDAQPDPEYDTFVIWCHPMSGEIVVYSEEMDIDWTFHTLDEMPVQDIQTYLNAMYRDFRPDACPGCGCLPGQGLTPDCHDPDGCGYWRDQLN